MARHGIGDKPALIAGASQPITNPTTSTDFGDTGAVTYGGLYEFRFIVGGSVAAIWQIEHRNAANSGNNSPSPYYLYTAAGQSSEFVLLLELAPSERVRIRLQAGLTGTAAAQAEYERLQ